MESSAITRNHRSGRRLHMLIVNCLCQLLDGMARIDFRRLWMYSGLGSVGLTYGKGQVRFWCGCGGHRKRWATLWCASMMRCCCNSVRCVVHPGL